MSTLLPFPGVEMIPLNYFLVQSTLCLGILCTQVCSSLLGKLAVRSVICTDIGLGKDAIDSADGELFLS